MKKDPSGTEVQEYGLLVQINEGYVFSALYIYHNIYFNDIDLSMNVKRDQLCSMLYKEEQLH